MSEPFDAVDVIVAKRDGRRLTDAQIDWVIDAYTRGVVADEQMSALNMAILLNGMDRAEIARWTAAMIASGERMSFADLGRPTADKHSTGGVGDKITLPLAPLVAVFGVAVPQLSGRGLGHTGGTLDKLESIRGWRAALSNDEMMRQLADVGAVSFVVAPVVGDHTDIVDDLTSGAYAWLLPYGAYVLLDPKDVPGASFDDITWEDGKKRTSEWRSATLAPGAMQCLDAQTSIEAEHDPTQWRRGGTTADGLPVMVPIAGGNEASKLTRWFHEQHSGTMIDDEFVTGADAGYRYLTDDEFLAAHALIAIQAPDGAWHLRMRADAANIVYECA